MRLTKMRRSQAGRGVGSGKGRSEIDGGRAGWRSSSGGSGRIVSVGIVQAPSVAFSRNRPNGAREVRGGLARLYGRRTRANSAARAVRTRWACAHGFGASSRVGIVSPALACATPRLHGSPRSRSARAAGRWRRQAGSTGYSGRTARRSRSCASRTTPRRRAAASPISNSRGIRAPRTSHGFRNGHSPDAVPPGPSGVSGAMIGTRPLDAGLLSTRPFRPKNAV